MKALHTMSSHGSPTFVMYTRNLRRIYWAEFIDVQTQMSRARDPVVVTTPASDAPSLADIESLSPSFEYHRHRNSSGT